VPELGLRAQLLRLETALASRDARGIDADLGSLLDDDFLEFGASGASWDAAAIRGLLQSEPRSAVTIEDFEITELAPGVVLATYRIGHPRPSYRSSIWLRRGGGWVMRFHQGTLAGR